jgi:hypothetical protein
MAQPGSAEVLGTSGRRFESCCPDQSISNPVHGIFGREREAIMTARIYRPARSATQSGAAKSRRWVLEFEPEQPREIEPLMGWTSSSDMKQQIQLWFDTKEEAIDYARREGIEASVFEPQPVTRKTISYSDNFRPGRLDQWTH